MGAHQGWALSPILLIRVQNPQVVLNLFPGQTSFYEVVVHNGNTKAIAANFQASVVSAPTGASGSDIHLTYPSTLTLSPGNIIFQVQETVAGDAHPGTYAIANTVTVV